jgi:hypothetical protein
MLKRVGQGAGTYIVGDANMRLTKLRKAMLCVSLFLGGIRLRASCLSDALRYLTVVDSGKSGNVNLHILLAPSHHSFFSCSLDLRSQIDRSVYPSNHLYMSKSQQSSV